MLIKMFFNLAKKEDVIFNVGCPSIDVAKSAIEEEFEIDLKILLSRPSNKTE